LHYECGALIINNPEIIKMREDFVDALTKSQLVTLEAYKKDQSYKGLLRFFLIYLHHYFNYESFSRGC